MSITKNKLISLSDSIQQARDLSVFVPTEPQRRVKSRFWSFFADSSVLPPSTIDLSVALMYGSDRRISDWWSLPGFTDWFQNKDEFRQRMEYLAQRALDELEGILNNKNEMSAGTKVQAIKIVMEIANKQPKSTTEKFLDEKIGQMTQAELEEYISRNVRKLSPSVE